MWMRACIFALTIGVSAQKPFALRECEREISERRQEYTVAYEEDAISETLYGAVIGLLETTRSSRHFSYCDGSCNRCHFLCNGRRDNKYDLKCLYQKGQMRKYLASFWYVEKCRKLLINR